MNISSSAFEIYFDDVGAPGCGSSSSSAAGTPPKKGRGGGGGAAGQGRPPRCQVEGCNVDLSDAKSYYSRHKVCGKHSKSPKVIVSGIHQRFCQQCSRFHQLPEFDQEKRSCRRRLAGHNERRRKPPMGSLLSARYGSSTSFGNDSGGGGSFLMDFSTYPRHTRKDESGGQHPRSGKFPAIPRQNNSESPSPEIEHKTSCGHAIPSGGCFAGVSDSTTTQKALPLRLNIRSKAHKTTYPGHAIPSGGCFAGVSDSSCALSLLSNQSCDSRNQSLSFGANYLMNAYGSHVVQPAITHGPNIGQFSSNSWGFKGNEAAAVPYDMHPELGLGHISQPGNNQYTSDLPLTHQSGKQCLDLEHSMTYDSSAQHMRWSR